MQPKAPHANCQECPLRNNAFVPSSGPEDADVIVVSRSAGYYDVQARRPFSGPSGKLLDYLLEESGRSRDTTRVTNVVLCACDAVPDEAIKCCAPRLRAEITAYPRRVIIAAGAEPTRELTPFRTVGNARGQVLDTPIGKVVATSNPAAALRDDTAFPDLVADFKRALVPRKPFVPPVVYYTEDIDEAFDYISHLSQYSFLSCDIEARGLEYNSDLVSLAMCGSEGEAFVFGRNLVRPGNPFLRILDSFFRRGNTGITEGNGIVHGIVEADNLRGLQRLQLLADVAIQRVDFCWHNGQYDTKVLRFHGVQARVDQDTLLLHYCVDERGGLELHSLDHCLQYELDWPDYTPEIVVKGKKCGFTNIKPDEWPVVYRYNGFDAAGGYRLYRHLRPLAMDADVLRHYDTLLIPGSNALSHIEEGGVLYDIRKARRIAKNDLDPNMRELTFQAECIVGERINLRSPQQSAKFLYETCGAPDPGIKGKVKSVDKEAREFLTNTDWIDRRVREYVGILGDFSRLAKIKGTYIDGLIKRVDEDGRLRGNFLLQGTETGRLSSRRPNLQNQPRGTQIRQLYYAPEGRVIVQADYSQAELRTAAILSGDAGLQRIYLEGRDLHSEIARLRYGDRFSSEQRVKAKNVNFGILYGQGAFSFAQMYKMGQHEAQGFITTWWTEFPQVKEWIDEQHRIILTTGELRTAFHRRRRFHLITEQNKKHILKSGLNYLVQSVASDLTLWSLIQLEAFYRQHPERGAVLLTVHDSILFEIATEYLEEECYRIKTVMEGAPIRTLNWTAIPFKVDIGIGPNWGFLNEWSPNGRVS